MSRNEIGALRFTFSKLLLITPFLFLGMLECLYTEEWIQHFDKIEWNRIVFTFLLAKMNLFCLKNK